MSNGDVIPFILNYNKFSDYIYTNSNYIYLESDINDSLFIDNLEILSSNCLL